MYFGEGCKEGLVFHPQFWIRYPELLQWSFCVKGVFCVCVCSGGWSPLWWSQRSHKAGMQLFSIQSPLFLFSKHLQKPSIYWQQHRVITLMLHMCVREQRRQLSNVSNSRWGCIKHIWNTHGHGLVSTTLPASATVLAVDIFKYNHHRVVINTENKDKTQTKGSWRWK